ncbi:MAG: 1,4-dihydroxy-6-naphthoate synthase [Actinomycetota bacterium]|nr:1,4-dihydroxy-6-naphthoate synthase [Actinomycetota bacterium]
MRELKLGFSPCPNDTFMFHALTHGLVESPGFIAEPVLADVETLNRWALEGRLELTKLSYHAYGNVRDRYVALRAGGALGRGVGPLLVARDLVPAAPARGAGTELDLAEARVAVPGRLTTANLLLRLVVGDPGETIELPYDQIVAAVASGQADAGLIIHESRFTYRRRGLVELLDVGRAWETETGLPVPLGVVLIRRDLAWLAPAVDAAIKASIAHARAFPAACADYVREHAGELDDDVVAAHIDLYVNDFSVDVGERGEAAVRELLTRAEARGLVPSGPERQAGQRRAAEELFAIPVGDSQPG